jgi:Outer membrane protein beta-barrel domain
MKKIIVTLFVPFFTLSLFAQVNFMLFGGPQATSAKFLVKDAKQNTSFKFGFHLGVGAKVPIQPNLAFAPSAFYSLKGYNVKFNQPSELPDVLAKDNSTSIHSAQLNFLFQVDFKTKPNHMFVRFGPSLDFGLFGKEKYNTATGSVSRKMVFSFGDYGVFGANGELHLGYEKENNFSIYAAYTHGIASIGNVDEGPKIFHRVFGLTFGKYLTKRL